MNPQNPSPKPGQRLIPDSKVEMPSLPMVPTFIVNPKPFQSAPANPAAHSESPIGKIISILSDGSVVVRFPVFPIQFHGYTFEVYKSAGPVASAGTGKMQVRAPGQCILVPDSLGFTNPEIGDTVRVHDGASVQPREMDLAARMANLLRSSGG